ncbi:MAG: hypothetical protein SFZ03_12420 [Candidatus Melainabacteria bacterium]|nr:hypothetical protein [Candidatus Melainabacteria bacterium]
MKNSWKTEDEAEETLANESLPQWYEEDPVLGRAMRMLQKLPLLHQQVIATTISEFIRAQRLTQEHARRALGHQKVLGLLGSQWKSAWFHQDPVLSRAMQDMFKMELEVHYVVGIKILLSIQAIDEYARRHNTSINALERKIIRTVVEAVFTREIEFFREQSELIRQRLRQAKTAVEPTTPVNEFINAEMKVSAESLPTLPKRPPQAKENLTTFSRQNVARNTQAARKRFVIVKVC